MNTSSHDAFTKGLNLDILGITAARSSTNLEMLSTIKTASSCDNLHLDIETTLIALETVQQRRRLHVLYRDAESNMTTLASWHARLAYCKKRVQKYTPRTAERKLTKRQNRNQHNAWNLQARKQRLTDCRCPGPGQ